MPAEVVDINGMAEAIIRQLSLFAGVADEAVAAAVEKAGNEALADVKASSPVHHGGYPGRNEARRKDGRYQKGWRKMRSTAMEKNAGGHGYIIYNSTDWSLVHLLEYGHALVKGGRSGVGGRRVGDVKAYPHVKTAQDKAASSLLNAIGEAINKI